MGSGENMLKRNVRSAEDELDNKKERRMHH
jgi:hypothetical protein